MQSDWMKSDIERSDIRSIIAALESNIAQRKNDRISKKLLKLIDVPTRRRKEASIYKINKYTKENDKIIVPGKVLSEGALKHKISIAAIDYSKGAREELTSAGAVLSSIEEMLKEKGVKIII